MKILYVLVEYGSTSLDRTFSYLYDGDKPIGKWYRVSIKFNNRSIIGFVTNVVETSQSEQELEIVNGYAMKHIEYVLDEEPLISDELMELANKVSEYYLSPLIGVLQAMLPKTLAPKRAALKGPKVAYETYVSAKSFDENGLTPKQIEVLRTLKENGEILKREAGSPSILEKLY